MKRIVATTALLSLFAFPFLAGSPAAAAPSAKRGPQKIYVSVTTKGFEPATIPVKAGKPFVLVITRKTDRTCATEIVVANRKINTPLPLNKPVEVKFAAEKAGTLRFACGMDMISGEIVVQ